MADRVNNAGAALFIALFALFAGDEQQAGCGAQARGQSVRVGGVGNEHRHRRAVEHGNMDDLQHEARCRAKQRGGLRAKRRGKSRLRGVSIEGALGRAFLETVRAAQQLARFADDLFDAMPSRAARAQHHGRADDAILRAGGADDRRERVGGGMRNRDNPVARGELGDALGSCESGRDQ